jgi:SAM-dependent methyltransferase
MDEVEYDAVYFRDSYQQFRAERATYVRRLLHQLGPGNGRRLIDIGAGIGIAVEAARELGWAAQGIDLSPVAAGFSHPAGGAVLIASSDAVPFRSGSAHATVLLDVIAHVKQPTTTIAEATRVLGPGGILLVKTPNRPGVLYRLLARSPRRVAFPLLHCRAQKHGFSQRGLAALLIGAGLEDVTVCQAREAVPLHRRLRGGWRTATLSSAEQALALVVRRPSLIATGRRSS